ncbi:MAG: T9SS type A sorting domain-containing protein [Ignavibacteria bacterium]|nr:T9SS type A sorting domain-containing protein [Ignavibacteria bacterium]
MNNANGEIRGQNLTGIVIIVSVQQISSAVPESFTLSQNYPNPFNPATKINFTIPKQEIVKLRVYDLLGKQVAELVSENLNAGSYSIDFNGSDLSSGTYFYRIETPSFNDTKRMILVK